MWLSGRESTCQGRIHGFNPWVGKIPWRRKWQPTPVFLAGKSHGQKSLVGYSSWGRKRAGHNLVAKQHHHPSLSLIWFLFSLFHHHSTVMFGHPGLPSARILRGQFSQNSSSHLMFPLSNFSSTDSHSAPCLQIPTYPCIQSGAQSLSCYKTPWQ